MRIIAIGFTALAALTGLTGCDRSKERVEQLEGQVAAYQARETDLRAKVEGMEAAASELDSQVDRFDSEDWKAVVPDVRDARDGVMSAQAELDEAAR